MTVNEGMPPWEELTVTRQTGALRGMIRNRMYELLGRANDGGVINVDWAAEVRDLAEAHALLGENRRPPEYPAAARRP